MQPQTGHHNLCLVAFPFQNGMNENRYSKGGEGKEDPGRGAPFSRQTTEKKAGDNEVRGGREVSPLIANPTACADGGRGGDLRGKAQSRSKGPP